MDQERRSALLEIKLGALVRDAFGDTGGAPMPFPGGAARLTGGTLDVLIEEPVRSIGPALALAAHRGASRVRVLASDGAGRYAAQAAAFSMPIAVHWVRRNAERHDVGRAEATALAPPDPPPDAPDLVAHLVAAGLDVVAEHGRLAGELRGLEVARIQSSAPGAPPALEVGVGQADRELTAMLHGELSPDAALARVVDAVAAVRRPGADPHPLNRLAPERWLRWVVRNDPARIGAIGPLDPVPSPHPRSGLRDRDIASVLATLVDGTDAVVVCSVGVDVDLVPLAADARTLFGPDRELVLVVPARDVHRTTIALAAALVRPARIISLEGDWRAQ